MKQFDDKIQHQIEAYLNQDMTDLERSRFEKQMHQDPELHEEVEFQESMIEAIRAERMVALKSGLNQVSISMWSTGLIEAAKIAAISVGIGLAGFGAYSYYQSEKADTVQVADSLKTNLPVIQESAAISAPATEMPEMESGNVSQKAGEAAEKPGPGSFESQPENAAQPSVNERPVMVPRTKANRLADKNADVASSSQVADAETREPGVKHVSPSVSKDITLPEDGITRKSSLESVHPEVVIKRDNKDKFHYQFSDSKLILYADFSDKLYEVLELNQKSEKQLFFAYDNRFFYLDPNQTEISPLKEVKDKNLVQVLTAYQKRRN